MPQLFHLPGFDDPVSAMSHLLGAIVFVALGWKLVRRGRGNAARVALLSAYAASVVILLSLSGVYHMMVGGGTARAVMQRLDHAAIFVLIAGTFTPIHGLLFEGILRWGPLVGIWSVAVAGIAIKSTFMNELPESVGLTLYLTMGWFGVGAGTALFYRYGWNFIAPLALGGVAYSSGAVMEFARWPRLITGVVHAHEVFHIAVLAGASLHFAFIWQFANEATPRRRHRGIASKGVSHTEHSSAS